MIYQRLGSDMAGSALSANENAEGVDYVTVKTHCRTALKILK